MSADAEQIAEVIAQALVDADVHQHGIAHGAKRAADKVLPLIAEARTDERRRLEDGLRHLDPDSWYKPAAVLLELGLSVAPESDDA